MTIYVIQSDDPLRVKIGFTSGSPADRVRELQTGSPSRLCLRAVWWGAPRAAERELHARFQAARHRGEWFVLSEEIRSWMATLPAIADVAFWEWLRAQERRNDAVGDLAEDTAQSLRLHNHPNRACAQRFGRPPIESSDFDVWLKFLESRLACFQAKEALIEAFEEWEGVRNLASA